MIDRRVFLKRCTTETPLFVAAIAIVSTTARLASAVPIRIEDGDLHPNSSSDNGGIDRLVRAPQSLTVAQQEQLRAVSARIKSLPPLQREQFRNSLLAWRAMSPPQREKLRNRWQRFRSLPPDQQEKLRRRFAGWRRLSPEEQQALDRAIKRRQGS